MPPAPVIRLHPDDGVLIARSSLPPGMVVANGVTTVERIPAGHKVAIKPIALGEAIRRYGQIIGFATIPISPGQHVHTQNCGMGDFAKDYAFGVDVTPTPNFDLPATFEGIRRADGRVATRNYIGILTSVNCSAHVAGMVADIFKKNPFTGDNPLADFPNVDGVVALTHKTGCGMTQDEPGAASAYARRLCAPRELFCRRRARPRLRGQPDRRADERAEACRPFARIGNSGNRRHPQDRGSRRCLRARGID
jgi:altronate hydrolase